MTAQTRNPKSALTSIYNSEAAVLGMTAINILLSLREGERSRADIAERMDCNFLTISQLVYRLEKSGFIVTSKEKQLAETKPFSLYKPSAKTECLYDLLDVAFQRKMPVFKFDDKDAQMRLSSLAILELLSTHTLNGQQVRDQLGTATKVMNRMVRRLQERGFLEVAISTHSQKLTPPAIQLLSGIKGSV
ncbi:hypothetical protein [Neptuniibacter sp. QD37_11]|uniref:hypothetical protein n=1 Tax=Neptuniibacter sp. QD37_11 TaxID=3398209 RepID=UPI0039F45E8A